MGKREESGQTLVELALVLPCFCLGVFMAVQLICYCHNMVELQRMAQLMSDRISYDSYADNKVYKRFNSLWGHFLIPQIHFSRQAPQPWRPFRGISTVQNSGQLFGVSVKTDLLPGAGFSRVLDTVSQQGVAETFLEPPIPVED
jgi:hypothetical protein